jgi:hypothetical protein
MIWYMSLFPFVFSGSFYISSSWAFIKENKKYMYEKLKYLPVLAARVSYAKVQE